MHLETIQAKLQELQIDGWLLYDFRRSNDLACRVLNLPSNTFVSRRWAYWIPAMGSPIKVIHRIEKEPLEHLPGEERPYAAWQEWQQQIERICRGCRRIAMEYSPLGILPIVSRVDAGFADLVRSFEVQIVSSAELIQLQTLPLTAAQVQSHLFAAKTLNEIVNQTWEWVAQNDSLDEYRLQQFIMDLIEKADLVTEGPPICAVNANSANPHYFPTKTRFSPLTSGDWLLIDLSAKQKWPGAIFGDLTRLAILGSLPSVKQQQIFEIVKAARDAAISLVETRFSTGEELQGWEVDACCRKIIEEAGYGAYFIHRTGHSIDTHDHGSGTNLDDYETRDTRLLLRGSCFSIEPGIYFPGEFGVRLEENLYVDEKGVVIVSPGMQQVVPVL